MRNVKLPRDEESLREHSRGWESIQHQKYGQVLTPQLCGAMDGLVIECTQRSEIDLQGRDPRTYLNRKGFFGWVALAIVDAYCSFTMFEVQWPGATNDSTAFDQSEALTWLQWLASIGYGWVAADDAFSASSPRVLTPFTRAQLRKAKRENPELYARMRAFNFVLSQQRITVERAFGILVRRWGILWTAFERLEVPSLLMIIACVKLHNICVARWKINNPGSVETDDAPQHSNIPGAIWGGSVPEEAMNLVDTEVIDRLENKYVDAGAPRRAGNNAIRVKFSEDIKNAGIDGSRFADDDCMLQSGGD